MNIRRKKIAYSISMHKNLSSWMTTCSSWERMLKICPTLYESVNLSFWRNAEDGSRIWRKASMWFSQSDWKQMQGSRAENKESRQCHPYSGYHILYHHYNTGSPIFFFRQHDSGQCRNIAFSVDMESSRYLYSYCNLGIAMAIIVPKILDKWT